MEKDILNYLPTVMFRGTHCRSNKVSLTYERYTPSGCKNIRIIKLDSVIEEMAKIKPFFFEYFEPDFFALLFK